VVEISQEMRERTGDLFGVGSVQADFEAVGCHSLDLAGNWSRARKTLKASWGRW